MTSRARRTYRPGFEAKMALVELAKMKTQPSAIKATWEELWPAPDVAAVWDHRRNTPVASGGTFGGGVTSGPMSRSVSNRRLSEASLAVRWKSCGEY